MGSCSFYDISYGETPSQAFNNIVDEAKSLYGSRGYTGTIAEKNNFTMATDRTLPPNEAYKLAESLINSDYSDKWGAAGCIRLTSTPQSKQPSNSLSDTDFEKFLFFGWASE
jgi:sulfur carrier protein ThiS